jgi:hypothetical protein
MTGTVARHGSRRWSRTGAGALPTVGPGPDRKPLTVALTAQYDGHRLAQTGTGRGSGSEACAAGTRTVPPVPLLNSGAPKQTGECG